MITTGYQNDKEDRTLLSDTEMIKIDRNGILSNEPCQLPKYPLRVYGAKGAQLHNDLVICGGVDIYLGSYAVIPQCFKFDATTLSWNEIFSMGEKRCFHGMTTTNDTIFVCGGNSNSSKTCEKFENGRWSYIQSLPTKLSSPCMLAINATTIVTIGGYDDSGVSKYSLKII